MFVHNDRSATMRTEWFLENHGHVFLSAPNSTTAICAPTGIGKSTGAKIMVENNPSFFGKTLFIFPTAVAMRSIMGSENASHIHSSTPHKAINILIRHSSQYETIILDEAHFVSREYYTILRILYRIKESKSVSRLFLLSATMNKSDIKEMFGEQCSFVSIPNPTGSFHVDVRYRNYDKMYVNFREISDEVVDIFSLHLHDANVRAICFVATHDQCASLSNKLNEILKQKHAQIDVFTMHGGMTEDDITETRQKMGESTNYICVATNMLETSLTFVGVNLIIDTGIRCVLTSNILSVEHCDQISMIQRAGRTGRTCDGVVYRVMKKSFFESLPYQSIPIHNFDLVVLQLFNLSVNPVHFLEDHARYSIERFETLGIMSEEKKRPCRVLAGFLESCGLDISVGMMLFRYSKRIQRDRKPLAIDIFMLLFLSILHMHSSKPMPIVFFPQKANKVQILAKIRDAFEIRFDPVMTILHIMLGVFMNENPKEVAAKYSFNFKTLREMHTQFRRLRRFIYKTTDWKWRDIIRPVVGSGGDVLPNLTIPIMEEMRLFIRNDPVSSVRFGKYRFMGQEDQMSLPQLSSMIVLYEAWSQRSKNVVVCFDDSPRLWTLPPYDYRDDNELLRHLDQYEMYLSDKRANKRIFDDCVQEIREEVAFRPGMYMMLEAETDFEMSRSRFG